MIHIGSKGSFSKTEHFLTNGQKISLKIQAILERYGDQGVIALSSATPIDTGTTASQWTYMVNKTSGGFSISWLNNNIENDVPVVILIQYGHGTKNGAYVQAYPFVNQTIKPILTLIANNIWKEVARL